VVIKNTFLSNTDNASVHLRKLLLESCNLHTVLDCPGGTFQGAGVKTVVLFFEKAPRRVRSGITSSIPAATSARPTRSTTRTWPSSLRCKRRSQTRPSPGPWTPRPSTRRPSTSREDPNGGEEVAHRTPQEIMDEIAALDAESAVVLESIRGLL